MPKNDYNNTKNEDEKIIKGLFVQKLCSNVLVYDDFADEISQKTSTSYTNKYYDVKKLFHSIYFIFGLLQIILVYNLN